MSKDFKGFNIKVDGDTLTLSEKTSDNEEMTDEDKIKFQNWFEDTLDLKTLCEIKKLTKDSETRTIDNCFLIRRCVKNGVGVPDTQDDKCIGYEDSTGELHETCKECRVNTCYEEQK